ncbi:Arc family DNA-binding protein [Comamonas sp. B-9]|uniref:Arc family DNA-binding protein n=1 Tax=Comamonas sp. B-9 TaxID=1055192 RepID=UPI0009FF1790|nr:Arc family DNA-binding protein [Comamonas sp. B-9]
MQGNKQRAPSPVRLPEDLKVWLKHRAIDNRRSFNSEITVRLEQSRAAEEAAQQKGATA